MGDEWLAKDKLEHFIGCLLITNLFTYLASASIRLRRWRIFLGALAGLTAGTAKEAGDAVGLLWPSAGPSLRDGVADIAGVVVGVILELLFFNLRWRLNHKRVEQERCKDVVVEEV